MAEQKDNPVAIGLTQSKETPEMQAAQQDVALLRTSGKPALAPIDVGDRGVVLRSFDDLQRFAAMVVASGACPKGMNQASAAMAIQAGLERGLSPLGGLQACVVINGLLSWRGWAAMALIRNSGLCKPGSLKTWKAGEGDQLVGVATAWRQGYAEPDLVKWTVKDAITAGLWGKDGPWRTRPGNMLVWRAVGDLARFHWSDILGGFPLAEEAEDFTPIQATAARRVDPIESKPPSDDPLLATALGSGLLGTDLDGTSRIIQGSAPGECGKDEPPDESPCGRHPDVDNSPEGCWKCLAEAAERAEAEAQLKLPTEE